MPVFDRSSGGGQDKVLNEMSSEVLIQVSGQPPEKLAKLAKKLVQVSEGIQGRAEICLGE